MSGIALLKDLRAALGDTAVLTDPDMLALAASDLWTTGGTPAAVVRPADAAGVSTAIRVAASHGHALIPRGGGLSYTGGYVPPHGRTVCVDLGAMNKVIRIAAEDLTVTAEAGATWRDLDETLRPHGLRLPFFGTFSGAAATVGGGLSHGAVFFGSARYGSAADQVLGLEIALADGRVLRTGREAVTAVRHPLLRGYGPDLTGLFLHDGGALGIKTAASFRLIEAPAAEGFASYAFADLPGAAAALSAIARAGVAEEVYVLDPVTTGATTLSGSAALRTGRALLRAAGGPAATLGLLADLLRGGQRPVPSGAWSLHLVAAGGHRAAVNADLARAGRLAAASGGRPVAATIPRVARAERFASLDGVLGAHGERWVALNAKSAHSEAPGLLAAFAVLLQRWEADLTAHDIGVTRLVSALGRQVFSFEVVFHWRDGWLPLHRAALSPERRSALTEPTADPEARALVARLREETLDLFRTRGATSNQLGRDYPFLDTLEPATAALLRELKFVLDPQGLMNPGVLGLGQAGAD